MLEPEADSEDEVHRGGKWRESASKMKHNLGMPRELVIWTDTSKLVDVPSSDRYRETIQIAAWAFYKFYGFDATPGANFEWFADISQNIDRRPWGQSPPMMAQKNIPYCFSRDRVLDVEDCAPIMET